MTQSQSPPRQEVAVVSAVPSVPSPGAPAGRAGRRVDPRLVVGALMLLAAAAVSVLAPLLAPHDPAALAVGPPLIGPSPDYPLGTDSFGRDQLSRVLLGTRISVGVAFLVAGAAVAVGFPLGLWTGYRGGKVDFAIGRVLDVLFAFPSLLLALVLTTILGVGLSTVLIALIVVYIPVATRFVRGTVLTERNKDYVIAAKVAGASPFRIMLHHIAPNVVSHVLVIASFIAAFAVLAEAALSFLGFGAQPPTSSLGKMLTENRSYLTVHPYLVLFPGAVIVYLVLALNLLGDALRDHFDPRHRTAT